jgi:pimeloyl-ACP methyl ester carboxylesterase
MTRDEFRKMEIVLISGFWLNGASWDEVAVPLRNAGHNVHALTLPGLESLEADRTGIGLRDHINAVIAVVDSLPDPVVLAGHSGGGAIAHAVTDARPDRIARVIYVDSLPLGHGGVINDELPVVDGEVPLPDWSVFGEEDLVDLDEILRERFRAIAIPQPVNVTSDKQVLSDDRRYDVPVTVIACEFSTDMLRSWMSTDHPWAGYVAELAKINDVELVDLPTGHWPQFTRPRELANAILAAVDRVTGAPAARSQSN